MNGKIIIRIEDDQVKTIVDTIQNFPDYLRTMFTSILSMARHTVDSPDLPAEFREDLKKDIYDAINMGASNILSEFAPEIEMRPTVTELALLRMENEVMEEVINTRTHPLS